MDFQQLISNQSQRRVRAPDSPEAHKIIDILLSQPGIDINQPEKREMNCTYLEGRSPLHWAVERGNVYAVEQLLKRGARTDLPDPTTGKKPVEFVQDEKDPELRAAWHLDEIERILSK